MLVFTLLTLQFIKIWLVVSLLRIFTSWVLLREMHIILLPLVKLDIERGKRVNVEQRKINKHEIRETEIAFSYY